jgi:hypothetical protein
LPFDGIFHVAPPAAPLGLAVRFTTRRAQDAIASSGETPLIKRFVSVSGVRVPAAASIAFSSCSVVSSVTGLRAKPLSNSRCTTCYSSLDENADIGILIDGE